MKLKNSIVNLSAYILCGTFCLSAVTKIIWWTDTTLSLEKLLLNKSIAIVVAVTIIIIEIAITLTIFKPRLWKYTGIFSTIILVLFTFIVFMGKIEGRITNCPCFGNLFGAEIGIILFIRNILLISLCIILVNKKKIQCREHSLLQTNLQENLL